MGQCATEVYRSRALTGISSQEIELLSELGIKTVYDLRKPTEQSMNPEPELIHQAFKVVSCTVDLQNDTHRTNQTMAQNVSESYGVPGERMRFLYGVMAQYPDVIRHLVCEIVASDDPVLVHCANGKDRAGVVCACVQRCAGVSYDVIVEDYLKTNDYNHDMNTRDLSHYAGLMPAESVAVLAAMFEARKEYLDIFFNDIDAEFGSFDAWMHGSCITNI